MKRGDGRSRGLLFRCPLKRIIRAHPDRPAVTPIREIGAKIEADLILLNHLLNNAIKLSIALPSFYRSSYLRRTQVELQRHTLRKYLKIYEIYIPRESKLCFIEMNFKSHDKSFGVFSSRSEQVCLKIIIPRRHSKIYLSVTCILDVHSEK